MGSLTVLRSLVVCVASAMCLPAAPAVSIQVDAAKYVGALPPIWAYFGYDEPNYSYTANGSKLLSELGKLHNGPVAVRTHNLLTTGPGTAAFKFGSTNAYREDATGKPIYDWTLVDRIVETYLRNGVVPFVEIGFMPKALSSHPDPYEPVWKPGDKFDQYYVGWTYPPNNFAKWDELIYRFVQHLASKYGSDRVEHWRFEVWNEPDIAYWHGTPEQYDELYDHTAAALKRALPDGQVGGPASTSPHNPKAAAFLQQFLLHCVSGRNYVDGHTGAPLDFISYHAKGQPTIVNGQVRMGLARELQDVAQGAAVIKRFPTMQHRPIYLTEADPEGCAACSARVYPPNAYRNGTLYPAYTATAFKAMLELAGQNQINLQAMLTWAFEFEGQPSFDGFRTLATNGVDKPVLNFFRMAGLLSPNRLQATSSLALTSDELATDSGPQRSDVDVLASRSASGVSAMIWNYSDVQDDGTAPATVSVEWTNLPRTASKAILRHYRIDEHHSNAYTAWKQLGSPSFPDEEQTKQLQAAGQLQLLEPAHTVSVKDGKLRLHFPLPNEALSLLQLSW